jgi:hypothetical protein
MAPAWVSRRLASIAGDPLLLWSLSSHLAARGRTHRTGLAARRVPASFDDLGIVRLGIVGLVDWGADHPGILVEQVRPGLELISAHVVANIVKNCRLDSSDLRVANPVLLVRLPRVGASLQVHQAMAIRHLAAGKGDWNRSKRPPPPRSFAAVLLGRRSLLLWDDPATEEVRRGSDRWQQPFSSL